jgi:hypothetical protein
MRQMLQTDSFTCTSSITQYHYDFKQGTKGQKPPRNELPIFLVSGLLIDSIDSLGKR